MCIYYILATENVLHNPHFYNNVLYLKVSGCLFLLGALKAMKITPLQWFVPTFLQKTLSELDLHGHFQLTDEDTSSSANKVINICVGS